MNATRLCFIRHGETAWNAERRIQGQLDEPLSEVGHAQARAVANWLAKEPIAAIYASDLSRALHTAEAAAHLLKLPIRRCTDLRERHYGVFQRLTYEEVRERYPGEYARFLAREADFALPGGGESLRQFSARVIRGVDEIVAAHPGGLVLVFTHGGVLDILHRRASGKPLSAPRDFEIPNAGLNWFEVAAGEWSILSWAERVHLAEALDEL
ncbi:MAG: histidine phosphatase family protein [Betaproteobacteria bacterium]|jgi:probable phosphoglycerate mutase|nr:histidine phosphatase family protein [Betaproteobacteria bacterium]